MAKTSNRLIWIAVLIVILLVVAGGAFLLTRSSSESKSSTRPVSKNTTTTSSTISSTTTITAAATTTTLLPGLPCGGLAGVRAAFEPNATATGFTTEVTVARADARWALVINRPAPGSSPSNAAGFTIALCQDDNWRATDFGPLEELSGCSAPPAAVKGELCP